MRATGCHVEARGEGARAVVLAHGFAGSARNWRPQVRALQDRWRVVTYDAPGHARSPAPAAAADYTLAAATRALGEVVAGCGDRAPVVGGLSMGAAVALEWALAVPTVPRALVLAAFPAGPGSGRGISAHAAAFADAIDRYGLEAAGARFAWGPASGLDARGRSWVRQGFLEHPAAALAHTLRGLLACLPSPEAQAERLAALALPVLVLTGDGDAASLAAASVLAQAGPHVTAEVVPAAGHVVNLVRPAVFNDRLAAFLEALPPGSDPPRSRP